MWFGKLRLLKSSLILAMVISSCTVNYDDVYKAVPRGSRLSLELLRKSKQIIKSGDMLILVLDISQDPEFGNLHLLFFNKSSTLESAAYLPAIRIDSVYQHNLYAVLHAEKHDRKSRFRSDLPDGFKFLFTKVETTRSSRIGDKVVEGIKLKSCNSVHFYVRQSRDLYSTIRNRGSVNDNFDSFVKHDSISCLSWNLDFNYSKSQITRVSRTTEGLTFDEMIVRNKKALDSFYEEILRSFPK